MVEECQGYGAIGRGGCVFDLLVCWDGMWVTSLGEVYWEVDVDSRYEPWKVMSTCMKYEGWCVYVCVYQICLASQGVFTLHRLIASLSLISSRFPFH